jgi:hypothetical protein
MWALEPDRVVATAEETHSVRYFLPREIELILELAGFTLLGNEPLAGSPYWSGHALSRLFWGKKDSA